MAEVGDIMRAVFRLEGERTVCLARLGHDGGAEAALDDVDERLGAAMEALSEEGVGYPLHVIARRYALSQEDYLVLQLALLPWHGADAVRAATEALGDPAATPLLSHAVALVTPEGFDDWAQATEAVLALTVFEERLVIATASDDAGADDKTLAPSRAVIELLGLD